jgi:hypothetical protein
MLQTSSPADPQFPFDRPCPDTDIVMMPAGPVHDNPFKFLTVLIYALLYCMRNQVERDVPFDPCRPPGHQGHPGFFWDVVCWLSLGVVSSVN